MNEPLAFPTHATERRTCKPSGFVEYDQLSGYVTRQYVSEWQDSTGTRWRKVTTIINLGRPDRGRYSDPDAMIEEPELGLVEVDHRYDNMAEKIRQAARERRDELVPQLVAYLEEHGPCSTVDLAREVLGRRNTGRVRDALQHNRDKFVFLGGQQKLWGLAGHKYGRRA